MMIAAAFLVLLRPYSIQCVLLLLLLLLGTIATILFFCCWHRKLRKGKHPIKSVLSGRSRSREAGLRSHHFRSEGYRQSPRHARRSARARVAEETQPLVEIPESEQEAAVKKRKTKKRVQPEFYHSVQVTPTRKPSSGSGNASHRCSMSSSADFSDEDDFSQKSGSVSPALGDTLPWNLPRHERSKRKIQGGSILDPAERAVLRIADERDRVQKKTFAKWINQHLMKVRKHVNDLYEDLRDGHNLISLLEVLSGQTLPREKGRMRFHRLQNVQIALDYLKKRQVKLVNIRNDDITDGNPKLTLGLIWTIILHFQISDIHVPGVPGDMTAKEKLLLWSQQTTESYVGVRCENFTTCWRDGRLFNAIIHKYRPDLIDMNMVATQSSRSNLEQAFCVAEQLGVTRLLDPEDVDVQSPDEKSVITYVSILYDVFPKIPEGEEGITAHDVDIKWVEYQNMVNYLSQWIRHHLTIMSDRTFPNNPVELKALYNQYLQFKETEIPPKENDKTRIKHLYKLLESWIEFGRIKLPQEYHPNDVEREWGKLIIAMLEREKSLRPEVDRLEMLQQIASRVQRDCVAGEDKLVLARNALQSDAKRLESGIQFQNEAEIAGYLLECESLLRQQVVDIQILLDGKYYLADQLVQRVSKLRDDFLALKSECSSVYSRGRTLTTEQTKMMISGITQSLNSGFSQNMNPGLNTGLSQGLTPTLTSGLLPCLSPGLTSSFTSSLTPCLTPSLTPAMTPGLQPAMVQGYVTGMDSTALQSLKLMQIRKPLVKSSLADPNLTEEEVNMNFVQDLLNWVEEMQVQLDRSEWGSDLPTVETHLENHKSVHRAIEDFQMSLKEAKFSEIQMTSPHKYNYSERLSKLENQYGKLLNSSRNRQKYLESLHEFVSRATREIIWLNEKEEEEVAYDWSDRNSNMAKKRDYHADLMRELDEKERAIKSVQDMAERLLLENHPAKLTIEAYRAAMQTQWSWILQLCGCVEQHLKENAVYFEFFNDAKESMDYLNNLQDTIQRKYGCDRTSNLHKLEDLIKESMDEKEQLLQYRSTVASLVGRAKGIAQLKPRNPDGTIRCSIPVKAICDYRQIEITIFKEDECVLASNSYRAKWKVISPNGNEAMVPSVCFTIPPPNKEAIETVSRIEQLYQNVLTLWHHSHINMKSVVSWHYLMNDIEAIQNSNVASIKTMLPGEHQQVLSNLQSHFEDFLEDSQESEVFTVSDRGQLEREVVICKQYYEDLLKSAEREEHEESVYNLFISEVRNFRMRLENYEERLIRQIRAPLERDDLQESVLRIAEQEKSKKELDRLKEDLETMQEKCETFISQAASTPSVPTLSTELNVVVQNMNQVYSMSSIYLEKLKTVSRVVKNSQGAEALVRLYEAKLCEEDAVNAETKAIETVVSTLKLWCTEIDEKREVFHDLEDELQKARAISDRMFKMHNERDFDLDWHKEKADQLAERWQNVHSQIENRLRDLECTCKSLKYYKDTYHALDEWIKEMEDTQLKMQENQPEDSKALAELLNQQKVLVSEIEMKQSKIDECQKYSEQYSAVVKDYELQLMTYRAMVDSQQKSPVKRRRMQSSSDVIQEFMDLRTRYTALVTLMTQYVKFASETLKRTEEEEYSSDEGELYPPMETEYASNEPVNIGRSVKNAVPTALPIETAGTNKRDLPILTNTHEDGSFPATEKKENERDSSPFEAVMQDTSSIPECSNYIFPMDTIKGTIGVADSAVSPESTVVPKKEHTQGLKKKSRKAAGTKQNKCCPATCIEDQEENRSILTEITSGSKDPGVYSRALQTQLVAQVPLEKSAQVSVRKAYQGQDNQASEVKISDFEEKGGPQSNLPTNVDSQNISNTFGDEIQFNMGEYYPEQYADIQVVKTDENAEIVSHRSSSLMQNNNSTTIDLNSVLQIFEEGDELSCYQKDLVSRERKMCRKPEKHHDTVLCVIKDTSSFTVSDEDITDEITVEYLGMMKDQQPLSGSFSVAKAEESLDTNSTVSAVRFDRVLSNKEHIFKRPGVTLKDEALDHQFSQETDHEEGRHLQSGTNRPHTSTETADNKHPTDARMEKEGKTVKDTIGVYNKATLIMDSRQQKTEGISYKESITCGIKDKLLENQPVKDEHFIEITSPEQKASKSTAGQSAYEGEGTRSFMSDSIGQYIELTGQRNLLKKLKEGEVMTKAFKQSQISTEHQRLENEAHLKDNKEKSVEEEKKEHGEKVSKLLNWASNMKKTNIKEEKLLQDEKNVTKDTSYKPQVSMEEVATKKEQIAEALRTTQLMLVKHSDKMTEEERQDTKEQLKSLQQAYNDLSRQSVNQLPQPQSLPAEQNVAEKQKEYTEKLQELCHHLTQTENRLIGHQQTTISGDSLGDLQQFQTEHQALQRDVQAGDSALTEVVRCTKKFLEENRGKLQPEQIAMIENKLEEANSKSKLINQRAEESRKDLDKAMTTAIKQETEKVAAVKQLEESKNKIEGLLGWLSNVGKEKDMEGNVEQQVAKQNGNLPLESTDTLMIVEEDEANGNLQQVQTGTVVDGKGKATEELDLNKEYDKVKAHHQEILSQQPDFIIATQSAQALLEKQGHMLSPEEKEKLQRNIQELKDCYETTLTKTEHKMKQIHSVQEELQKFKTDCSEFENWLQQSEGEITDLKTGAPDLSVLNGKLQRQRSFSEDVISHKGDLRFITISGQRVLDAAKSCSKADTSKDSELDIDTSGVCTVVQDKLDSAANRYKTLHSQCNQLGNNLKDVVEKYKQYEDASTGLGSWLAKSEEVARKQLAEPVAADPKNLQKQLEETKALQGQMSGRQGAVEKLRKTADALTATEGDLLTNQDTIQETVDDIVERYDNLSKAVSDRNEKLQITLTRSLSVQDGLDEMLTWMEGVEKSLGEKDQVPLNSTAIQDILSKKAVLEQDFSIRQSSITAMKEKVKKFIETADPSTASSLQAKMDTLSKCFTDSCKKHKEKVTKLEELKDKVELFEKTAQKVQQFVAKRSQALSETDGPGKNVNELSQLIQDTNAELSDYAKDVELLRNLSKELAEASPEGSNVRILEKVDNLSKKFKEFEDTFKEKEEEVSSCQGQLAEFKCAVESFRKWLDESTEKIPVVKPACSVEDHQKHLLKAKALLEEWLSKASMLQEINNKGSALCNLISVLTSPVKTKTTVKSGTAVENDAETHAYLTNKELTVVQQNMSYVNHGYEILGVHLKENVGELDGMLVKLREVQDEANSLMQWFDDINKTTSSWDAVPTEAESMKTQMEQQKTFEAELKQKQGKLKQLKEKLLDLLEKHPDSPEAAKWKQMLNQIDSTWKDINSSVDERKQKLEESSKNLTQFQTAEAQLKQWLAEKELMMSVLGPLSIDPNMLNAQKQQVQILQNEFDTRKSQYHQLKESAQGILERPGDLPPSCKVLKDQLAAVAEKWENLTGRLSDRSEQIDQAIVKTNEFQNLLKKISENVDVLNSKLNSQSSLSTQPDAVKQQLETANEICTKLGEEKKNVEEAEVLCKELSALVCEEYLKTDLSRQLESVKKPFKDLEERTGNRIQQLNSAFASSQQFHQMSKDFHGWLDGKRQEHSMSPLISAELETLQQTIKEHAEFQKSLNEQNAAYEIIIKDGETLLQKTQGAEKSALQSQLALLKANWDELKKQSSERQDKLQGCLQRAQKYKQHVEKLRPWIEECENKVAKVKICIDPAEVERSISEVKTLQKDLDKHRGMVELLNTAADSLFEVSQADEDLIRDEKASFNQKVDNMTEQLQNKKDSLEEIAQRLKEFNESHKEAKEQLYGAKQQLEAHESLGAQAYSNKHLTNMKAQQKTLETLKTQVDYLKNLAQGLVVDAPDAAGVSDLLLQTDSLNQEYNSVNQQVEEKCSFLETKLQGIGQFQNNIREMFSQFADFDDELDSMQPVARDLDTLQSQKDDMKSFVNKLQELMVNTVNANKNCKKMLETEGSPDLLGLKRDLEALNKQCSKLMDRAKGREELVETTLIRVDELYKKIEELSEKLQVAKEHEESQGPVGMETEIINQQLDVFKVFQKEEIEPLQAKLQDVNWLGQGLIQSAAKNANTQALEGDLEDVTTRWNTLNKKVAERDTQLHEALLHCGRFQDALESLLSWLNDTEDLVANQKPPSAEFKVVKAQIQEQKLLQRLLDDRKPTVDIIKREGEKLSGAAEPADKEKMLKELGSLDHRWDALLSKAETRHRQLESILVVAQQFHETLEPLAEWLSATEKRLANSEPIGTQTKKLEQQISQHKALEDDIMGHSKNLHQAISLGQTLKTMSSMDDKELVQGKLDSTQTHAIEVQERCSRKAVMLQQALSNAQLFGEDEVALMNWLNEVHDKLSNVAVQDYNTDVLHKQHYEQLALHEDIVLRKQNVHLAIQNGLKLLKQTTGDEVVIIQEKLDGIKARYAEVNSMSTDVSKSLNQALTLATKLQQNHEELCSWLDNIEAEVAAYEVQVPAGEQLTQVQERQKELLKDAKEHKRLVDTLNEVSSALLELVPWRAREGLDKLVCEDNERYRLVSDSIMQHVEEIAAAILRSQQFEHAAEVELEWLTDAEKKLASLGDIRLEQDQTVAQLQVQKAFSIDILRHKDAIDEIVKTGEAIISSSDEEEKQSLQDKVQTLLEKYDAVSHINAERYLQLERAQSLASQFWETYDELWPWLQETRSVVSQLPAPAIEYETLKQQEEELRQMRELIAEHKPHIDKMNKTGPQLLELSPVEGLSIQEKYTVTDKLFMQIKEDVKQRAVALDEAISKSTQFHDKIDPMMETLGRIAERLRQPPSISVEVEKIREQISENKNVSVDLEKLQPGYETLKQRGEEMIARSEGADKDISAKAVQDKLDHMVFIWEDIQALLEEREAKLLDVMDLAEKFWFDHCALIVTIKDTQDLLRDLEEPGTDPSVVKQQQESVESFKEEIDGLQEELDVVQNLADELMAVCGEPDKPVIKKSIDELNSACDNLNKNWKERVEILEEAMQSAVQFQDGLQGLFDWVDIVESKLDSMSPVGTDLETVKQQIGELKEFKLEAYQLQIEMERLNQQAEMLLKKVVDENDRHPITEPLTELRMLWDSLDQKIINRQHKLEGALLALGQFQHALDELLTWLTHTEDSLKEQKKTGGDPKAIEIELAKHHVLQNDVLAHKTTVEAVEKAGNDMIESSAGEEASSLQSKLENLNQRWKTVLEKTGQRQQHLESALLQAQGFHGEIEDMQKWLKDTERQLLASKAVGGLPETAREQLNIHLELLNVFEAKEEQYISLMQKGQQLITICPEGHDANTEQDLKNLKEKWESVQTKTTERKVKLEEALTLATQFHNSLQDFINWLTQAEQTLTMATPASLILDDILFQIDEHKVFVTEVNCHREQIIELDKTGTHLKYFSQKQDVVLIKNLLISVQSRWEKVVQRSVERGRALDDARKRAKQFHEAWNKLMEWLEESEKALDSEQEIANDPDKIKMQLAQHKDFQKALGGKHSVFDTSIRTGRSLKEKTSLKDDNQKLDDMLSELRDKWDTVCGKSVERQNKLEEALLFSGHFTDALQALIDWLYKVEPQLAEDQPVHGDIDLVLNLIDNHKVFQKELGKRTSSVQALKRSARELTEISHDDSSWVKVQMQELSTRWETVCALSVSKQTRLEQALCQAEEFHSTVHILLEWLAEAEQSLRFHGALPDDEEALCALLDLHKEFMRKLEEKRVGLSKATGLGEVILTICHPDSITTIKHWNTIIKARFEEVLAWAKQHQHRLGSALKELLANRELLETLLGWLQWAETTLNEKDKETIPQQIEEVKTLIAEHQTFMEEMTRKQPNVDKLTKTYKRRGAAEPPPIQSNIPVLDKGRGRRKRSPMQRMYPSSTNTQIETKNPRVNLLVSKWQQVWLLALDRRRKLNDALDRLEELREFANFDFDIWRKRYMRWMNHKKSRVMDFFRRIDKDQDGKITRQEFIDGILSSKFPTSRLEMSAVADIFDRDGDGYIDYYEFVAALHPNKDAYKPLTDADKIEDEVTRQVAKCKCPKRFQVEQIGANKYRFFLGNQFGLVHCLHESLIVDETLANRDSQNVTPQLQVAVLESCILFGDSQQLRLVRILRSTVMVRVGGGWMALDEFLVKNDPCRVHHHGSKMLRSESNSSITTQSAIAKGRTNMELREKFILPEGVTQIIGSFRYRGHKSRPSSRAASPNRSNSSHCCVSVPPTPNLTTTSTPKNPHHITRNYDKPWLTNSKTSTPVRSSESPECQVSPTEGTPIQGSKLRLPGYLSGKGFHAGEESSLITAAASKARTQSAETKKTPSRPGSRAGSKAGSRASSRRGSDASDFDISEILSVCSDMSETVPDSNKTGPRAGHRPSSAKPSKIPTPQRRSPAASKLAKASKR
ncbi:dystonin-like isoform X20 [Acipenser ruthenus]|uniref:dystonin-like isoform X20 n=1 Tax=Acipenser ruthenus TaxID=7906 RepID=UPI002741D3DC|nr:dystonin-like isoform X20 [Acipenser ruthenus]